jgi:hypothetical protein
MESDTDECIQVHLALEELVEKNVNDNDELYYSGMRMS